jgi:antitoxin component of MazEF toxin-antitoxin module
MKKLVKKWGNSLVVVFSSEEAKIHDLKAGDVLDLTDMIKVKKEKKA